MGQRLREGSWAGLIGVTKLNPLWTYSHHGMISAYPMDFGKEIHVDHKYAIVFWEKMKFDLVWTGLH